MADITTLTPEMLALPQDVPEPKKKQVEEAPAPVEPAPAPIKKRERSERYVQARSMVDRTHQYGIEEAVELVKRTDYARFDSTLNMHINLRKEIKPLEVAMPHSTGKKVRVAILNDEVLEQIAAEEIEFDVLLAKPAMMSKLVKHARFLGPRGLMPNPKNGTVTTDPEAKKAELEKGVLQIKTEKKAPLIHVRVGKQSQSTEEIKDNIFAIIKAIGPNAVAKAVLAGTMSPGVRMDLTTLQAEAKK